jgi:DNA-binding Lrp family transcriptional regulator
MIKEQTESKHEIIKLDILDKKILVELNHNCRQTASAIAKKTKANRYTVAYKIENLEKKVIKKYITSINLRKQGYEVYKIGILTSNPKIMNFLLTEKNVIYLLKTIGIVNYTFSIAVKNTEKLAEFITKLKNFDNIQKIIVHIILKTEVYPLSKLLLDEIPKKVELTVSPNSQYKSKNPKENNNKNNNSHNKNSDNKNDKNNIISEKSYTILKDLANNAKMSCVELAQKHNLSAENIAHHIKKSQATFRITYSLEALGFSQYALLLNTNLNQNSITTKIFEWSKNHKNVLHTSYRIGPYTYIINIAVKNTQELYKIVEEVQQLTQIQEVEILYIKELLKLNYFI